MRRNSWLQSRATVFTTGFLALLLVSGAAGAASDAAKPVRVRITGVEDALLKNVRTFLSIQKAEQSGKLARINPRNKAERLTPSEVRRRHRQAEEEIGQALAPYGYYRPEIQAELTETDAVWKARYRIDPGPPTRLRNVDIRVIGEGSDAPAVKAALQEIDIEPGDRLRHPAYEAAKSSLFDAAYNGGYLQAAWKSTRIKVGPKREFADLSLVLDTGALHYFGDVSIDQDILRDDFVARYVPFGAGDRYAVQALLDLQLILSDTGYFSRVNIHADPKQAGPDHRVPVRVETEPAKPRRYSVGAGYATDTGPRVNFGATFRRLNRRGHTLDTKLQLSSISQEVAAHYEIPIQDVASDRLRFSAAAQREEVGDAETDQFRLGASRRERWLGLERRVYLTLQRENFDFGSSASRTSNLLLPGVSLQTRSADDVRHPRRGYSASLDLHGGHEAVISDTTFVRLEGELRWIRSLGERSRVLLHGAAGVMSVDAFSQLPPSERFFNGGDRSVRGYGFEEIGPRNDDNDVIGGERMWLSSVEYEHLIVGDYGAAVFVDAGDAFRDNPGLQVGAGVGFRWRAPFGMVRIDLAHPFDDPDRNIRLHLSIGPDL